MHGLERAWSVCFYNAYEALLGTWVGRDQEPVA